MALSEIALPLPVDISDLQVACRAMWHLFILEWGSPLIQAAIKSPMMKESFCRCGCRLTVPSSRDKFLSLMNFHVCEIQKGEIQPYRAGRLFEKIFPEHPISNL